MTAAITIYMDMTALYTINISTYFADTSVYVISRIAISAAIVRGLVTLKSLQGSIVLHA